VTFDSTTPPTDRPAPLTPVPPVAPAPTASPATPVATGPEVAAAPRSRGTRRGSGRLLNVVLGIAAAVAIGGVAFAVGRTTAPAQAATVVSRGNGGTLVVPGGSFAPGANGGPGFVRGGFGGSPTIRGTVESIDGDTMTINTPSGQRVEVTTTDTTTYHTQTPAEASDVRTGSSVEVQVQFDGNGGAVRPNASGAPTGPIGTAGSVTVVP
jgi:hypothetical protein